MSDPKVAVGRSLPPQVLDLSHALTVFLLAPAWHKVQPKALGPLLEVLGICLCPFDQVTTGAGANFQMDFSGSSRDISFFAVPELLKIFR